MRGVKRAGGATRSDNSVADVMGGSTAGRESDNESPQIPSGNTPMNAADVGSQRIDLRTLTRMKAAGRKFAMLTAYDYPTAALAQAAGVHSLLIGDSLATVLLGHPNTRPAPLAVMLVLGEAVRRGRPKCISSATCRMRRWLAASNRR